MKQQDHKVELRSIRRDRRPTVANSGNKRIVTCIWITQTAREFTSLMNKRAYGALQNVGALAVMNEEELKTVLRYRSQHGDTLNQKEINKMLKGIMKMRN